MDTRDGRTGQEEGLDTGLRWRKAQRNEGMKTRGRKGSRTETRVNETREEFGKREEIEVIRQEKGQELGQR